MKTACWCEPAGGFLCRHPSKKKPPQESGTAFLRDAVGCLVFVRVTVLVVGVVRVFFVTVIFVVFIGGDLFTSGFFGKKLAVKSVSVSDVGLMCSCFYVVFFVCVSCEQVMLRCEFKVMRCFAMRVGC